MRLPDVNVLLYAFRDAAPDHASYRSWLEDALSADEPLGVSELVLSSFVRIATHPRISDPPATVDEALAFANAVRAAPNAVAIAPGPRHWSLFERLCRDGGARGNLVADAYLAALAVESGSELVTTDRDFARFPGLRWSHPFGRGGSG
jgi:toxin-antitoxin system PIN domain toxin